MADLAYDDFLKHREAMKQMLADALQEAYGQMGEEAHLLDWFTVKNIPAEELDAKLNGKAVPVPA